MNMPWLCFVEIATKTGSLFPVRYSIFYYLILTSDIAPALFSPHTLQNLKAY